MIFALAVVLLAAPVWADVTITFDWTSETECEIGYEVTGGVLVRAFALDVTAKDGNVVDVNEFAVGDDNNGYGIFPANFSRYITVNDQTGEVDDWDLDPRYTPVAEAGDTGALGGLDTNGVTLEMGALYDSNAPGTTGKLCKVVVTEGTTEICVTGNAIRGNVVLEDTTEVEIPEVCSQPAGEVDCFPDSFTTYVHWEAYGKPKCWCNSAIDPEATGDYQCDGDGDGATQGLAKYRIYTKDLDVLIPSWQKKLGEAGLNPCADYDHKPQGLAKYRVYTNDLQKLIDNWQKKSGDLGGDCGLLSRPE
jgi:hypothetical protein